MKDKIFFMDRDGTINIDTDHVFDHKTVQLIPNVSKAIALIKKAGFITVVVSNQSCVGRNYAKITQVDQTMNRVNELLLKEDPEAVIDLVLYAPDHPDHATNRRKPNIGMIQEALNIFPNTELDNCYFVGDKITDPITALNAGIPARNCILVNPNDDQVLQSETALDKAKKHNFEVDSSLFSYISKKNF
jgi:histidinol-phosphate phosphatase family protein